jgi:hypothetical protein
VTVPQESPEFWAEQAQSLTEDLVQVDAALETLRLRLTRAIGQAADLGLMREQHDTATIRTVVRGEQELSIIREQRQDDDRAAIIRLEGRIALVECRIETVERMAREILDLLRNQGAAHEPR